MTLYLDVFFLLNAVMNALLLFAVRRIGKIPAKTGRIAAGAAAGAFGSCLWVVAAQGAVVQPVFLQAAGAGASAETGRFSQGMNRWLWRALEAVFLAATGSGMVYLAFAPKKMAEFWKEILLFLLVSMAAGGVLEAVGRNGAWSLAGVCCIGIGVYLGGTAAVGALAEQRRLQKKLYEVTIHYQGKQERVTALLDTGNRLYEPYGHKPVHVISGEAAARLGSPVSGVIYIPFSAVGTEHGMMPAVRADWIDLEQDGAFVRRIDRPWLGISREPLSGTRQYEMLLHGEEE